MIRVVLFDDEPVILEWLRTTLSSQADIEVVGEAMTTHELLQLVQSHQPDVLVMDVPTDANFLDAIRQLQAQPTPPRILVFTALGDAIRMHEIFKAGVLGYLLRSDDTSYVAGAIRAVAGGLPCESPTIRQQLLECPPPNPLLIEQFSPREREVLKLLAEGLTRKDIVITLGIKDSTLRDYLTSIRRKTGLTTREQLIAYAARHRFDLLWSLSHVVFRRIGATKLTGQSIGFDGLCVSVGVPIMSVARVAARNRFHRLRGELCSGDSRP